MEDEEEEVQGTHNVGKIVSLAPRLFFLFDTLFVSLMGWCDYHLLRHNRLHQVQNVFRRSKANIDKSRCYVEEVEMPIR